MSTKRSGTGNRIEQAVIVFLVVGLVSTGIIYMPAVSGGSRSEPTSSSGYLGTNNSTVQWGPEICLTNSLSNSTLPSIAVDNSGGVHVVWIDYDKADIFYMKSMDGGNTWSDYEREYTTMPDNIKLIYNNDSNSLHMVYVAWDIRRGNPTVHHAISQDYGKNWLDNMLLQVYPPSRLDEYRIDVASESNYISIALNDYFYLQDKIYVLNERDALVGGKTFDGISCPSIAAWNSSVYAVIPTNDGLNFSRSNDNGTTWSHPIKLSSKRAHTSTLFTYKNSLYLVWGNNCSGNYELYFKKSDDGGITWSEDRRLTYAAGASILPSVSMNSDGSLNIVWEDNRDNNWEIYYKKIDSDGKTLMNSTRLSNSTVNAVHPQIITDSNGYSYVVWQDRRNGKWDVYMRRNPDRDVTPPEIVHEPVETIGARENLTINATVTDNFGVQDVSVRYWGNRSASPFVKEMALTSGDMKNGTWQTEILPSELHSRNIYYCIQAEDSENVATTPVYHVVVTGCSPHFESMGNYSTGTAGEREINISITDTLGVDSAVLYYSVNGSAYPPVNMSLSAGDSLSGVWSAKIPELPADSNVSFYIEAVSGDTRNSTEVFSFVTEKNSNSGLNPDNTDTSSANSTESNSLAALISSNPLPIIAGVVVLLLIIGALLYRRKGEGKEDNREIEVK